MTSTEDKQKSDKPWLIKPGQVLNPLGRQRGSRNKLGEEFVAALQKAFQEQGESAIQRVLASKPEVFLSIIAKVIPKEFLVKDNTLGGIDEQLLARILEAILQRGGTGPSRERTIEGTAQEVREIGPDRLHDVHVPALPTSESPSRSKQPAHGSNGRGSGSGDAAPSPKTRKK